MSRCDKELVKGDSTIPQTSQPINTGMIHVQLLRYGRYKAQLQFLLFMGQKVKPVS